jgi:hypothetical protein
MLINIVILENRIELIIELTKTVPEWITLKELSGKLKIIKIAANVDSYTIKQKILGSKLS